jgi:hypothetical protein
MADVKHDSDCEYLGNDVWNCGHIDTYASCRCGHCNNDCADYRRGYRAGYQAGCEDTIIRTMKDPVIKN